jgi:O-antigen ligase
LSETALTIARPIRSFVTLEFWQRAMLWLLVASGFFVIQEPAPYELLFLIVFILFLPVGMRIPKPALPLVIFLILYNVGGALGLIGSPEDAISRKFVIVSFYMAITGVFFCFIVAEDPLKRMATIRNAYAVAGVIAAITGIIGYFGWFGMGEAWAPLWRAQGTFKDPNVLSTFLIPPFIFLAQDLLLGKARRPMVAATALLVISFGLLLAFSRGAWGNVMLASLLLVVLTFVLTPSPALRNRIMVSALAGGIALVILVVIALNIPAIHRLFEIRASLAQSYDVGETGRFGNQIASLPLILTQPNGMNPRHFHYIFGEDPHNVYLNAFASYGWLGGASFLTMVITSFWAGWRGIIIRAPWQHHAIAVYCTLVSTLLQAIQIDIDHWRHFYLLLGSNWGLFAASLAWAAQSRRQDH